MSQFVLFVAKVFPVPVSVLFARWKTKSVVVQVVAWEFCDIIGS